MRNTEAGVRRTCLVRSQSMAGIIRHGPGRRERGMRRKAGNGDAGHRPKFNHSTPSSFPCRTARAVLQAPPSTRNTDRPSALLAVHHLQRRRARLSSVNFVVPGAIFFTAISSALPAGSITNTPHSVTWYRVFSTLPGSRSTRAIIHASMSRSNRRYIPMCRYSDSEIVVTGPSSMEGRTSDSQGFGVS